MKGFQGWWSAEGGRFKERTAISARYDGEYLRLLDLTMWQNFKISTQNEASQQQGWCEHTPRCF